MKSIILFTAVMLMAAPARAGNLIDYTDYEYALSTYVNEAGFVNYQGLKQDRARLDSFVRHLGEIDEKAFNQLPEAERLAFWINAYNALTLRGVIDHYPIKSFKSVGSVFKPVWDKLKFKVLGQTRTLNQIEHKIIRKQFNEPRIHVAINCAAHDCPRLLNRAYKPEILNKQLDNQSKAFISNPAKFQIDRGNNVVRLSKIFDWFGKDFIDKFLDSNKFRGKPDKVRAVLNYASAFVSEADRTYLDKNVYKIDYFDYDWSLNKQR